jgi:ABC-type transport system substrate-binding protein
VKVRQALSYAVPYQDIITVGVNGLATQAKGPVPVGLWPNTQGNVPQYATDLTKAKQLLSEAGYPNGGFTVNLTYAAENALEDAFTPVIKESFAGIGVRSISKLWNQQWAKAKGFCRQRQDLLVCWWPARLPDSFDNLNSMFRPGNAGMEPRLLVQRRLRQAPDRREAQRRPHASRRPANTTRREPCWSTGHQRHTSSTPSSSS